MYQPVSYRFDGRAGTREELKSLINTCRSLGVRVYADIILNHFTGGGNDMNEVFIILRKQRYIFLNPKL